MKSTHIVFLLLFVFLVCSCNREESTISDYKRLAKELKINSLEYTEEDWKEIVIKFQDLEEKAEQCHFSDKQKKVLNNLRGKCAAYMLKSIANQTEVQIKDAVNQFSDMANGFLEALSEDDFDEYFNDEED